MLLCYLLLGKDGQNKFGPMALSGEAWAVLTVLGVEFCLVINQEKRRKSKVPSKISPLVQQVGEIMGWKTLSSAGPNPGHLKVNYLRAFMSRGHRECLNQRE